MGHCLIDPLEIFLQLNIFYVVTDLTIIDVLKLKRNINSFNAELGCFITTTSVRTFNGS